MRLKLSEALRCMEAFNRLTTGLDRGKQGKQITGLARRLMYLEWDVRKGRHQLGSFIGAHLRKEDEAKRRSLLTFPDCNETDTCAVCLKDAL
ncbi:unnamed protein product [Cylicocyclus nassatus]|uniref:Uncharacterized protein n=1 Tax=Cylicocyclus nassatus TaxID=53992 RepID=A0AA36GXI3_CYLNA|nr:unnamed protein product [Cylicocyclus nassatus]